MIDLISRLFHLDQRTRLGSLGIVVATFFSAHLLACGWAAAALPSEVEMWFFNGEKEIAELNIGDDLWVSASLLPIDIKVMIELVDEGGEIVASVGDFTGPLGAIENSLLWFRSGVVGCDPLTEVDPLRHRFKDFPQAEVFLKERSFRVRIVDEEDWLLAEKDLPLTISPQIRYFFSDEEGCPRSEYYLDEDVYMSAVGADPRTNNTVVFMVRSQNPLSDDGMILEVRREFQGRPQVLSPEEATGDWTVLLWEGAESEPGLYGGFVRLVAGGVDPRWDPQGDEALGIFWDFDHKGPHGIVIKAWACPADDDLCNERPSADEVILF